MKGMTVLAIDPGKSGGLAWVVGQALSAVPMPSTDGDVVAMIRSINPGECLIEELVKFTGKDRPESSSIVYGYNYGVLIGALLALGVRTIRVRPAKWQKALGLVRTKGMPQAAWKAKLRGFAQERFPGMKVTLGTADALCILEARRLLGSAQPAMDETPQGRATT